MKLLECVKNGETLKSAAKRFKINYSSAKSILHTFRKEGRILKKSAQERTTKKKINAENEHPHKPQKHLKKETPRKVQKVEESFVIGKPSNESNPLNSRKNSNCAARAADFFESHHHDQKAAPARKGSGFFNKTRQEEAKPRDDFYNHHDYETAAPMNGGGEAPMHHSNFMYFSQNETFPDMSSGFYNKNMTNDEFAFDPNSFLFSKTTDLQFLLDDKMQKMDGGVFEPNEGYEMNTLKNYMDHQNVYRTALRKASFFSSTSNGMRKSSFDMY